MSLQPNQTAAEAFERLRSEVALLRRAVEGVAAEVGGEPVDYSPTLAALSDAVEEARAMISRLGERQALALMPEQMGALLQAAAARVMARPIADLERDRSALTRATAALETVRQAEASRSKAWRRPAALVGVGALAGAVLWGILSGPMARLTPSAWNVPEHLASATLGLPMAAAGERLLRRGDPATWEAVQVTRALSESQKVVLRHCLSSPPNEKVKSCTLKLRND